MNVKSSFSVRCFWVGIWTVTLATATDKKCLYTPIFKVVAKLANFCCYKNLYARLKVNVANGILPLYDLYTRRGKATFFELAF